MANAANHVNLSTGQILFSDPTIPWTPNDFPNLPSTALALTAAGTVAGRNIEKLSFSNAITYQNYESPPLRAGLIKSLVVNSSGDVSYDDPKVSLVSTSLTAYNVGIDSFGSAAIGAAGINSSPPDTLTNAIAKLDGWITQNLLKQPPAVSLATIENNSFYAGVRWNNFNVYNVFQYSVPYTTGIVLVLGDPSTSDYLTLELTNNDWFPDRQYTDGLASDFNPIVQLRVFNKFFLTSADVLYSKAYMQANCAKIISESGIYTLPSSGKVFAIQNSVAGETYTTLNLYLPNIPSGTVIPINIVYINKTQAPVNLFSTFTSTTTFGAPSVPSSIIQTLSTPTSFTLQVSPPIYSDATHGISTCYFSSYNVFYKADVMNTAHSGDLGFRYGEASPNTLPSYLSSYVNSSFTQIAPTNGGIQNLLITGADNYTILPGIKWSTSIYATNLAQLIGSTLAGPDPTVSAFPNAVTQSISSASLVITSPWVVPSGENGLVYVNYSNGWNLGAPLSTNLLFLSTAQVTSYALSGNGAVRFNDQSYPGCRSNITFTSVFQDILDDPQSNSLILAPVGDDFLLNTMNGSMVNDGYLSTILGDPETNPAFQKFFYDASITGGYAISTISEIPQTLMLRQNNFAIDGFTNPIINQTFSTPTYVFQTIGTSTFNTSTIGLASSVNNLVRISGLYTPTKSSEIFFNLYTSNFVSKYANFSSFAMSQLYFDGSTAGPLKKHTSSIYVYDGPSEVTNLPFPQNVSLTLSSLTTLLTSNIYQDPADPRGLEIYASATPADPVAPRGLQAFHIGSTIFIDTVSDNLYSTFTNINGSNGQRVLSLLPRYEVPGTSNNMNDGINSSGEASNGLDVSVSSFFIMGLNNNLTVSSSVIYNNTSSISSIYTDPYSRELLFTNGSFTHPGGLNFSQFNGNVIGAPNAIYPSFVTDLSNDVNYGNRYASFAFAAFSNLVPTTYQYVNIRVRNPSALSTITNDRTYNYAFPDLPIPDSNVQYSKVRMHIKVLGAYTDNTYNTLETSWINCLKAVDYGVYDDATFDIGGCVNVSALDNDIYYKVQIDRRFYTSIYPIVRVGISRDGSAESLPAGQDYLPISFDGINVSVSDS